MRLEQALSPTTAPATHPPQSSKSAKKKMKAKSAKGSAGGPTNLSTATSLAALKALLKCLIEVDEDDEDDASGEDATSLLNCLLSNVGENRFAFLATKVLGTPLSELLLGDARLGQACSFFVSTTNKGALTGGDVGGGPSSGNAGGGAAASSSAKPKSPVAATGKDGGGKQSRWEGRRRYPEKWASSDVDHDAVQKSENGSRGRSLNCPLLCKKPSQTTAHHPRLDQQTNRPPPPDCPSSSP